MSENVISVFFWLTLYFAVKGPGQRKEGGGVMGGLMVATRKWNEKKKKKKIGLCHTKTKNTFQLLTIHYYLDNTIICIL